jgi:hypothetical protein
MVCVGELKLLSLLLSWLLVEVVMSLLLSSLLMGEWILEMQRWAGEFLRVSQGGEVMTGEMKVGNWNCVREIDRRWTGEKKKRGKKGE